MVQLKAGPELDKAIAEAIFGEEVTVTWCATSGCLDLPTPKDFPHGEDPDVMAIWKHPDHGRHWVSCPKYSTDLNAAFEAARIRFKDIYIRYDDSGSFWEVNADTRRCVEDDCRFHGTDNDLDGESLPLAICAAIIDKGEK